MSPALHLSDWGPEGAEYEAHFRAGRHDDAAHLPYIAAAGDLILRSCGQALEIGRPGGGGIAFCFRRGHRGAWAHYPIEDRFRHLAKDTAVLDRGWRPGAIKV